MLTLTRSVLATFSCVLLTASGCSSNAQHPYGTSPQSASQSTSDRSTHMTPSATDNCVPANMILPNGDTATICSLDYTIQFDGQSRIVIVLHDGWAVVSGCNTSVQTANTLAGDDDKGKNGGKALPGYACMFVGTSDKSKNDIVLFEFIVEPAGVDTLKVRSYEGWSDEKCRTGHGFPKSGTDLQKKKVLVISPTGDATPSPTPPPNIKRHDHKEIYDFLQKL